MGNITSRPGEDRSSLFSRDQTRFSITSVTVTNARNRILLYISPNGYPATKYIARRDVGDDSMVEYIQDPEGSPTSPTPSFLLRLNNDDELNFHFTFVIRQNQITSPGFAPASPPPVPSAQTLDTFITGLTFIFAPSSKELDNLVTREFHANPNLHKNSNVELLGDFSTGGSPSVQFQWTWKWKPPKSLEDRGGGWRSSCSFVEYDQRAHKLETLASFAFWVQNTQRVQGSPKAPSPRLDIVVPPRIRIASNQSDVSRGSELEVPESKDFGNPPPSPFVDGSPPEDALGLIPTETNNTMNTGFKVDVACQRREEDIVAQDDGPVFRARMKEFESRTGSMRQRWKKVLRKAEAAAEAQATCNDAMQQLMEALKEASASNANAVQPAIDHYFDKIAKEILLYERLNITNLQRYIIDPVTKLYTIDIKQADSKKKDFDEESGQYYAYMSRYLGQRQDSLKDKKRAETDNKHQNKRRNFELKKFDYSSYMQDLHGGRKDQEVLSSLTKYADAQAKGYLNTSKKIEAMLPQLEALNFEVKEADKEYQLQRTEREEKRRALEKKLSPGEPDGPPTPNLGLTTSGSISRPTTVAETDGAARGIINSPGYRGSTSAPPASIPNSNGALPLRRQSQALVSPPPSQTSLTVGSPNQNKFKGIRDLEERDHSVATGDSNSTVNRKEGLLWALSRPGSHVDPKGLNKQAWHKFWIVLDQGKISEYSNWKEKLDLHMEPIDLLMASVREARNAERRFCLEIVTPRFTRVYQAQSEDDMKNWMSAINLALQTAWKTKGTSEPVLTESSVNSKTRDIAAVLTGKSSSVHRSSPNISAKSVSRNATVGSDKPYTRSHGPGVEISTKLLEQVRRADEGNKYCADCGSESEVEWASINLGIIVCIECSGIHRSLGTHITKMRSLTLDTTSFTIDIVELLLSIGNRVSNMVWESRLDQNIKPGPQSTREQRLRFITSKYVDKAFVQPIHPTLSHYATADETLLASIKRNDFQNVLYGLALGANRNAHDRSRNTHVVFLALAAADPASPSTMTSPIPSPGRPSTPNPPPSSRKPFVVAEMLLQNGADLPPQPAPIPLSAQAKMYLEEKAQQREGRSGISLKPVAQASSNGDTLTALPSISAGDPRGMSDRSREKERLQKRGSTGARVLIKSQFESAESRRGL